jgi:hypothetical protein
MRKLKMLKKRAKVSKPKVDLQDIRLKAALASVPEVFESAAKSPAPQTLPDGTSVPIDYTAVAVECWNFADAFTAEYERRMA